MVMSESELIIPTEREDIVLRKLSSPRDYESFFNLVRENRTYLMPYCEGVVRSVPKTPICERVDHENRYGIFRERLLVGGIKLSELEDGEAEIGYWLGEKFTGNGYATIAVRALARRGLEEYSCIEARIAESNRPSINVVERVGFRRLGQFAGLKLIFFELTKKDAEVNSDRKTS